MNKYISHIILTQIQSSFSIFAAFRELPTQILQWIHSVFVPISSLFSHRNWTLLPVPDDISLLRGELMVLITRYQSLIHPRFPLIVRERSKQVYDDEDVINQFDQPCEAAPIPEGCHAVYLLSCTSLQRENRSSLHIREWGKKRGRRRDGRGTGDNCFKFGMSWCTLWGIGIDSREINVTRKE